MYHNLRTFNCSVPNLKDLLRSHTCSSTCRPCFFAFKALVRPRKDIESEFVTRRENTDAREPTVSSVRVPPLIRTPEIQLPEAGNIDEYGHLNVPSKEFRERVIREWQSAMAPTRFERKTCAVCAKLVLEDESHLVDPKTVDLELLQNKQLPRHTWPRTYNFGAYRKALLHPNGLTNTTRLAPLRACNVCLNDLNNSCMPKFALANWLYYGRDALPPAVNRAFKEASQFERAMISRGRSNTVCCRFDMRHMEDNKKGGSDGTYRKTSRGMRGNVIIAPMDTIKVNQVLPPPPEVIRDTLCVLFTSGDEAPTFDMALQKKLHPVLVRKTRVKLLIEFLLQWNPHYQRVPGFKGFSEESLNALFEGDQDAGFPSSVEISYLKDNRAMEQANSDYAPQSQRYQDDDDDDSPEALLMENVGFTLSDNTPEAYGEMKRRVVEHCLSNRGYIRIHKGLGLVPDFNNPYILSWLCPHIDPWGIGGFHHPERTRPMSMAAQLRHMMQMDDPVIANDIEFCLIFYNVTRKRLVSSSMRFKTPTRRYEHIVSDILNIDKGALVRLSEKFKKEPKYYTSDPTERRILGTLQDIAVVARHVPGSAAQKISMRNEIRGLIINQGSPSLFITFCPADKQNGLVQVFARTDYSLEALLNGTSMKNKEREKLASDNPTACALFFDATVEAFIRIVLRPGQESGLFG
ncbi:hypothetical protein BKA70DRAFT_1109891, partial [Coprinopsis sp. MPI-PUGE-AT-0042]